MGTIVLDAYKGWTVGQLKRRCRSLCRALDEHELIIAMMVEYAPDGLNRLPPEFREKAQKMHQARRSDDADA